MAKLKVEPVRFKASELAFGRGTAGVIIENTPFTAGAVSKEFYSIKNTIPQASTGEIQSSLSDKIVKAVLSSQIVDDDTIIALGKKDGKEFLFSNFSGGTKNPEETYIIIPEDKTIYATNIYSHLFYRTVIANDLLKFIRKGNKATSEEREIYAYLSKLNNLPVEKYVSESAGMLVDSPEAETFLPLCDSIYFAAKELDGYEVKDLEASDTSKYFADFKYNLLPLAAMHNKVFDLTLIYEDAEGEKTFPEIHTPKIKPKRKGKAAKVEDETAPYIERDFTVMSDKEAKTLPDDLKRTRDIAIELFERNKETITDELWEAIQSFKNGKITKMGFYGPSASGKTTFVKMMAGALKLPFMIVTGNSDTETAHLYGYPTIKDGTMEFCEGPLIKIMRHGGIFFFDEINMVNAGVISSTNNILDDTRMYTIPNTGETVVASQYFRWCEAKNIGYEGTKEDNLAHISRIDEWHKLAGYDEDTEADILVKETGVDKAIAKKMIKCKNNISAEIKNNGDETIQRVDLRSCLSWARKYMDVGDVVRASFTTILSPLSKEVDEVKGSNSAENFTATGDNVVDFAYADINNTFIGAKTKFKKLEYEFDKIEMV